MESVNLFTGSDNKKKINKMHWIDWLIVLIPVTGVLGIAIYAKKYVRGVTDFLAAGRYVISVGDLQAGLSVISLIALCESEYQY